MLGFILYTMPEYQVNWHHRVMCQELDRWLTGENSRLMLFMPPRFGKSEVGSRRLPAYVMGKFPDASLIATSYSADLSSRMNRDVQRIIDNPFYQELFPGTMLYGKNIRTVANGTWLRNSEIFEIVGHKGVYRSAGVGGGITGMGGQFVIIDDPIKNMEEANSEAYRERVWEWYQSTLYTRLEKDGRILLIQTRWHEDDLAGRLLTQAKSDPDADQWRVVDFSAIREGDGLQRAGGHSNGDDPREIGDALWPEKYSLERLAAIRSSVGSRVWASLYQQRPAPVEGAIIKRQWWRFWVPKGVTMPPVTTRLADGTLYEHPQVELPDTFDETLQSWDMAFKETKASDFVCGQVWAKLEANRFLLDQVMERWDIVGTIAAVEALTTKWPQAGIKLVEDKANGPAVISMLHGKVSGLVAVEPEGSKESRVHSVAPEIESGNAYLPHPALYPWVDSFMSNVAAFPNGAHDDDVDTMTQALRRWNVGWWLA